LTADTKPGDWLRDAAATVELPVASDEPPAGELRRLLAAGVPGRRADQIIETPAPRERIREWAQFLKTHADRGAFLLFAYDPARVLLDWPPEIRPTARWSTLVELYEAWSEIVSADWPSIDERSRRIGEAYLARTRWLLLSLPFTPGWEGRISALDLARVNDGSARIVTLARQARGNWLEVLGEIDDYPQFKQYIAVEDDAEKIAALQITRGRLREANPDLNVPDLRQGEDPGRDLVGGEVDRYVIARLLLPRFAIGRVWRIVYRSASPKTRTVVATAIGVFTVTLGVLAAGLVDQHSGVLAWAVPLLALGWYALITIAGAIWPATAWLWLMRQPASAAAGLLALAVAPPDWWDSGGKDWLVALFAVILLAGTGLGYLYFEAGSQDVRARGRYWRPPVVAMCGYLHAVLVTVIGLRFVLPEFAQRSATGPQLSCWWQTSGCGPAALPSWLLVLAAASWSFAAAVFLQIIWDDQPVTAPLAHASWHRKD